MKSFATHKFWKAFEGLPEHVQKVARKQYLHWLRDPHHPSLQFKPIGKLWSVRVTQNYRALAMVESGSYYWVWIGTHAEYEKILRDR